MGVVSWCGLLVGFGLVYVWVLGEEMKVWEERGGRRFGLGVGVGAWLVV